MTIGNKVSRFQAHYNVKKKVSKLRRILMQFSMISGNKTRSQEGDLDQIFRRYATMKNYMSLEKDLKRTNYDNPL